MTKLKFRRPWWSRWAVTLLNRLQGKSAFKMAPDGDIPRTAPPRCPECGEIIGQCHHNQ